MSVRVPTANPMIAALIDAQAFHDRQHTALGRAIDALRAVDEPIRDVAPQRSRTPSGRPRRTFSAAAKRRMSAGMRRFWKQRKAWAAKAAKAAQKAKAAAK